MIAYARVEFRDGSYCLLTPESWAALPSYWVERIASVRVIAAVIR